MSIALSKFDLRERLKKGEFMLSPKIKVVGKGLESLTKELDELKIRVRVSSIMYIEFKITPSIVILYSLLLNGNEMILTVFINIFNSTSYLSYSPFQSIC